MSQDPSDGSVDGMSTSQSVPFTISVGATTYAGHVPTLFAAPAALGDGSGSSEANAMELASALASAGPGAIIGLLPGIYTGVNQNSRYTPAWRITNDGTPSAAIRVVAKFPAAWLANVGTNASRSELRSGHTLVDSQGCPALGCLNANYQEWNGLYVNEAVSTGHPDTGTSVLWASNHCTIKNCVFEGIGIPAPWADNHNGVRCEGTTGCVVTNNRISNFNSAQGASGGWSHNGAGVMTYGSNDLEVSHNTISGCGSGIFIKGQATNQYGVRVLYNRITDCGSGLLPGITSPTGTGNEMAYNLVARCMGTTLRLVADAAPGCNNWDVHHNTFDLGGAAGQNGMYNVTTWHRELRDNLFILDNGGGWHAFYVNDSVQVASLPDFHHNLYFATSGTPRWVGFNGAHSSLSAWQAASGVDAGSVDVDPLLVDRAAGDYRLSASSPARTASSTGGPVGCFVSGSEVIGVVG